MWMFGEQFICAPLQLRLQEGCSRIVLHRQTRMCYQVPLATRTGYSLRSDGMHVVPFTQEGNNLKDLSILTWLLKSIQKMTKILKCMKVSSYFRRTNVI